MDKCFAKDVEENEVVELTERRELNSNSRKMLDNKSLVLFDALREKLQEPPQAKGKSDIELQLETNDQRLEELLNFGNELVNNIKGANEQQELLQSQSKNRQAEELQENLRTEAEESLRRFEEINKKWTTMNNLKEPMAIYEDMEKQRENIANLMASKDELIAKCQTELKRINEKYYADQNYQSREVCFLVERIDSQVELLKKSYKENINDLQDTIENEKKKIHEVSQEKWNTLYENLSVNEVKKMEIAKEKQIFYAQEVEKIRSKQEEITRTTRIRLEKDAEMLELEIRKTRANILMNSEKIDYNYQVLQKRNEENIIINNQQKRRVGKFNETIQVMRRKLATLKQNNKQAMDRLTQDIHKLHGSINDLQLKSEHFRKNNRKKFFKVWSINFREIKDLLTSVFEIDRILYEQQLAREWKKPDIDFNKLDYTKEKPSCNKSAQKLDRTKTRTAVNKQNANQKSNPLSHKQLHDILQKISDRAGFLVEERLLEILKPYTDEEKCLVRVENIFSALSITDIKVVESLVKYFEPYSWCPNCSTGLPAKSLQSLYSFRNEPDATKDIENSQIETTKESKPAAICRQHFLVMEPALVLTSLNEFTSELTNNKRNVTETRLCGPDNFVDLLQHDKDYICKYWQQFSSYMSADKLTIWKSVEHGLNHYLEVLKKRALIDRECVFLQNQNAELKHLLQKL